MDEPQVLNTEKLEQIKEILLTLQAKSFDAALIKDNKLPFQLKGQWYRCRMPSQREMSYAHAKVEEAYIQMVNNGVVIKEKDLKAKLKEKQGIDIDILEKRKRELTFELQVAYMDLASVNPDAEDSIIALKTKVDQIEREHSKVFTEIMEYLAPAIENKREKIYIENITWLCTEKLVEESPEKYELIWKSDKDFQNETDQKLLAETMGAMTFLLINLNK